MECVERRRERSPETPLAHFHAVGDKDGNAPLWALVIFNFFQRVKGTEAARGSHILRTPGKNKYRVATSDAGPRPIPSCLFGFF